MTEEQNSVYSGFALLDAKKSAELNGGLLSAARSSQCAYTQYCENFTNVTARKLNFCTRLISEFNSAYTESEFKACKEAANIAVARKTLCENREIKSTFNLLKEFSVAADKAHLRKISFELELARRIAEKEAEERRQEELRRKEERRRKRQENAIREKEKKAENRYSPERETSYRIKLIVRIICVVSLLGCILAVVVGLTQCGCSSRSPSEKNYLYTENADGIAITEYTDKSVNELVIPSQINGRPVVAIGDYAFSYCSSLTSITIPNSVTTIGRYACRGCSSLTIYCEAESAPSGWDSDWNADDRPVVWGYRG